MSSAHSSQAQYFAWRMYCVSTRGVGVCVCEIEIERESRDRECVCGSVGVHKRNVLKRARNKKGGGKGSHARQSQSDSRRLTFVMEAIGGSQHLGCWAMLQKSQQSRVPPVSHTTQASLCSSFHSGSRCLPPSTLEAALAPPPNRAHRSRSSSIWERGQEEVGKERGEDDVINCQKHYHQQNSICARSYHTRGAGLRSFEACCSAGAQCRLLSPAAKVDTHRQLLSIGNERNVLPLLCFLLMTSSFGAMASRRRGNIVARFKRVASFLLGAVHVPGPTQN